MAYKIFLFFKNFIKIFCEPKFYQIVLITSKIVLIIVKLSKSRLKSLVIFWQPNYDYLSPKMKKSATNWQPTFSNWLPKKLRLPDLFFKIQMSAHYAHQPIFNEPWDSVGQNTSVHECSKFSCFNPLLDCIFVIWKFIHIKF